MSVLGIVGSPRKNGLTAQAVQSTLKGVAQTGLKTETLYLSDFHIQPCRDCHPTIACRISRTSNRCYHKDEFSTISRKIDKACGLVVGSAVYYGDVTRSVDNLLNKKVRHKKERPMEGIPGIGIAVAGGGGGGYASALRQIYHYYRDIGIRPLKPIPVTRFNLYFALDEALEAGISMASLIKKGEYLTGSRRMAAFLELPILGFDYLQERSNLVDQIIRSAQKEMPEESVEKVKAMYRKAVEFEAKGSRAEAYTTLDEAYILGTSVWNPERR